MKRKIEMTVLLIIYSQELLAGVIAKESSPFNLACKDMYLLFLFLKMLEKKYSNSIQFNNVITNF